MQDDPWSMFASFDEAFWLEQAEGLESKALVVKGLNLPLRGEKREDWPPLPSKAIEGDVFPNAWELQQRVDTNEALLQALEHGVLGDRCCQCGLAVVNVADCADVNVWFRAFKL